jgi:8-oxo-dGTP pyrophosphatase MutT (NUDIX family)
MYNIFEAKLQSAIDGYLLSEDEDNIRAVVCLIKYQDKFLLGLNKTSDDRNMKWGPCAGHVKRNEDLERTAIREAKEEFGVRVSVSKGPYNVPGKKDVVFFVCRTSSLLVPKVNHEFVTADWFRVKEMKSLKLYHNVTQMINKASRS